MEENTMNKLTDNELNSIVDTAAEAREDSDAIDMLRRDEKRIRFT